MNALHVMSDRELADRLGSADAELKRLREEWKSRGLTAVDGAYYSVNLKHIESSRVAYKAIVDMYDIPASVITKNTKTVHEARFYIKPIA